VSEPWRQNAVKDVQIMFVDHNPTYYCRIIISETTSFNKKHCCDEQNNKGGRTKLCCESRRLSIPIHPKEHNAGALLSLNKNTLSQNFLYTQHNSNKERSEILLPPHQNTCDGKEEATDEPDRMFFPQRQLCGVPVTKMIVSSVVEIGVRVFRNRH
jgi:hypothetical protein